MGKTHLLVDRPMQTLVIPAAVVGHFTGPTLEDTDLVDTTTSREAEGTGVRNTRKGRSSANGSTGSGGERARGSSRNIRKRDDKND